jgi:hypothetical protein
MGKNNFMDVKNVKKVYMYMFMSVGCLYIFYEKDTKIVMLS